MVPESSAPTLPIAIAIAIAIALGPLGTRTSCAAEDDFELAWAGFAGGGGQAGDGFFVLDGTFGQVADGILADDVFVLEAGFWPAALVAAPSVVITPPHLTVALGAPVLFEIEAAGDPPLTYQWRLNGVLLPEATNASYFVSAAQLTNGGVYTVVISNSRGSIISDPFKLGFALARAAGENAFANRQNIASTDVLFTGDNTNATRETSETRHAGKPGGRSIWYKWIAPDTGIATFHTTGSAFDTLLAVYTGTALNTLIPVTGNDDTRGRFLASEVRFNAVKDTEYQIAVDGLGGAEDEFVLGWDLEVTSDVLPVVVQAPASRSLRFGASIALEVMASGSGLTYQWHFNQVPIPGATSPTLAVNDFAPASIGHYFVAITNSLGRGLHTDEVSLEAGGRPGVVSFAKLAEAVGEASESEAGGGGGGGGGLPGFQPAGAGGAGFDSVGLGIIDGHTFNNQNALPNPCASCGAAIGGAMQTYILQPLGDGIMTVDTIGSQFDTILHVYTNGPLSLICSRKVACDDNGAPDELRSLVSFPVKAGLKYLVGVDGVGGAKGLIVLNWKLCLAPAPFDLVDGALTLQARLDSSPQLQLYPDEPFYRWFRGDQELGTTVSPSFPLGPPPTEAASFSVRFTTVNEGAIQPITNQLGWILTMNLEPSVSPGFQQIILPGLPGPMSSTLVVEAASQSLTNCDGRWLWLPVGDYVVTPQETSVTITLSTDQAQRIHRVRPGPPLP